MFIGHFAAGFAAKRATPRTNLSWLIVAPLFLDLVFPVLLLAGVERARVLPGATAFFPFSLDHLPWSHSLLFALLWSALFAGVVLAATRDRRAALICGALVVSHWALDVVAHVPDMALTPWSDAKVGLGLWNSVPGTLLVECALYAAGLWLYFSSTKPKDGKGRFGIAIVAGLFFVSYLATAFGPPPETVEQFAVGILFSVVLIPLIHWLDGRREPVAAA